MKSVCKSCHKNQKCGYIERSMESGCVHVINYDDGYDFAIDNACKWIKENSELFIECEDHFYAGFIIDEFYDKFRKAMEEQR